MITSHQYTQLLRTPPLRQRIQPLLTPPPRQQPQQHIRQPHTPLQQPPRIPQKWHMEHSIPTKIFQSKRLPHTEFRNTKKFRTNIIRLWYEHSNSDNLFQFMSLYSIKELWHYKKVSLAVFRSLNNNYTFFPSCYSFGYGS